MEGYVIKNSSSFAMITSPIGGNYVSQSAMQMLKSEHHPKFHLSYEIASKEELKPGQTGNFEKDFLRKSSNNLNFF